MNDPQMSLQRVSECLAQSNFAKAAELASEALDQAPDHGLLWLARATAEYRLANYESARLALENAALLVPIDARTQCMLAECYARAGKIKQARGILTFLAEEDVCDDATLPVLAAGFGQIGDHQSALSVCRQATERQPSEAAPHFGAAYYLRKLGYPAAAIIPWASRAFDLEPKLTLYRTTLALLLAEADRREEAYDLLRDVPVSACECPCRVRSMMALFQVMGDRERWTECSERLREMRDAAPLPQADSGE